MQIEIERSEGLTHRTPIGVNRENVQGAGLDAESVDDMLIYARDHMGPQAFLEQAPEDYSDADITPPTFHRVVEVDVTSERESDVA